MTENWMEWDTPFEFSVFLSIYLKSFRFSTLTNLFKLTIKRNERTVYGGPALCHRVEFFYMYYIIIRNGLLLAGKPMSSTVIEQFGALAYVETPRHNSILAHGPTLLDIVNTEYFAR